MFKHEVKMNKANKSKSLHKSRKNGSNLRMDPSKDAAPKVRLNIVGTNFYLFDWYLLTKNIIKKKISAVAKESPNDVTENTGKLQENDVIEIPGRMGGLPRSEWDNGSEYVKMGNTDIS